MKSSSSPQEEKLMNIFWLRPAYQRHSLGITWWRHSTQKRLPLPTTATSLILVFLFLICISALVFVGWIDLAKYYGHFSGNGLKIYSPIEFPLDCSSWNQTNTCPRNYPTTHNPNPSSQLSETESGCPDYFRWIHEDLRHWKESGISREMVEGARRNAHFRVVILNGKLYVEKYRQSIQSRALFTIWGIAQLLRTYPGRLPDLELMFDCDDRPVIPAKVYSGPNSRPPPPLFRYCSDWRSLDIVFPDWSFWGWAETNIRPWKNVLRDIKEGNNKTKWKDRVPYAYWKGNPQVAPWRGDLMKCNVTDKQDWNTRLYIQDWNEEANKGYKGSNLEDQCTHRYKIYIEGWAWSVSEKYILACDSPTLYFTPRWYDFFIRGMIPQKHYWPVRDNDKCRSLKYAVEYAKLHPDKAEAIGAAGSRFIHEDMKMEYVYDYIFHLLNEYGKLLKFEPKIPPNANEICSENMVCPADGNWRKFMEESLEKSPSHANPCTLPPPYQPHALTAFNDDKIRLTREVEDWEKQYWEKQNNNNS